jgi:hypothetical protein
MCTVPQCFEDEDGAHENHPLLPLTAIGIKLEIGMASSFTGWHLPVDSDNSFINGRFTSN